MVNNIKLGRGGIREIEFIGQTLQLIRAGREPELRERSIVKVLSLLADKNYLQPDDVELIILAYWFLRKLENRLQMLNDMQTHSLPVEGQLQVKICLAMGADSWELLLADLSKHQNNVDRVFQNLVASEDESKQPSVTPFTVFWQSAESNNESKASANEAFAEYL